MLKLRAQALGTEDPQFSEGEVLVWKPVQPQAHLRLGPTTFPPRSPPPCSHFSYQQAFLHLIDKTEVKATQLNQGHR